MTTRAYLKTKRGFTLVELILVMAVICVLTAVAVPAFGNYAERQEFKIRDEAIAVWEDVDVLLNKYNHKNWIVKPPRTSFADTTTYDATGVITGIKIDEQYRTQPNEVWPYDLNFIMCHPQSKYYNSDIALATISEEPTDYAKYANKYIVIVNALEPQFLGTLCTAPVEVKAVVYCTRNKYYKVYYGVTDGIVDLDPTFEIRDIPK